MGGGCYTNTRPLCQTAYTRVASVLLYGPEFLNYYLDIDEFHSACILRAFICIIVVPGGLNLLKLFIKLKV